MWWERQNSLMATNNCLGENPLEIVGRHSGSKCLLQIINEFVNRSKCSAMYALGLVSCEKPESQDYNWDGSLSDSAACGRFLL